MNTAAPSIGNWGRHCVYCGQIFTLDGKRYTETCSAECADRMRKWREWQTPVAQGDYDHLTYAERFGRTMTRLPAGGRTLTAAVNRAKV